MGATHVFVETNWVVDCLAPAHFASDAACHLLRSAKNGVLRLHVPSICLSEARTVIRRKFQPRNQADPLRKYVRWAKQRGEIESAAQEVFRRSLDQYEQAVLSELESLDNAISALKRTPGVDAFSITEAMLESALSLETEKLELHPFDSTILPAILIRAEEIKRREADAELFFCELDGDLQPWDRNGNIKSALAQLYDNARVWVYGDFEMTTPVRRDDFPK